MPSDFLQYTRWQDSRWVRNAGELLEAIVESLHRLQDNLQGKPPEAQFLWAGAQPKEEEALSDYVKVHLDKDLKGAAIVALREVQIQRGEKTDLHVTGLVPGVAPGAMERLTVIVEVKGCWHSEVKSAMRFQLVERYLRGGTCRHGVYLVGWYRCPHWDAKDKRSKAHVSWTREAAERDLTQQALELSTEDREIRAFVLDATLRVRPRANRRSPRAKERRPQAGKP